MWQFDCLDGCLVCERRKSVDLSDVTLEELQSTGYFHSDWFLVSELQDLDRMCQLVNASKYPELARQMLRALEVNAEYQADFRTDLQHLNETLSKFDSKRVGSTTITNFKTVLNVIFFTKFLNIHFGYSDIENDCDIFFYFRKLSILKTELLKTKWSAIS